jgi:signal transduction histidine kinase
MLTVNDTGSVELADTADIPTLTLPPGDNLLEIELKARGMNGERKLFGLMRLVGLELLTHRIPSGQFYGFRQYVNLAPREYLLEFGAADQVGFIDGSNWRTVRIVVPPYWHQRWWAQVSFLLFIGAAVLVFSRREILRLRREKLIQQDFSRRQMESEEVERKRLASELHDGLGQNLLVASNELQQHLQHGEGEMDGVKQAALLIQESIQSVREMASNLHPHQLERLGFCAAVRSMTEQISHANHFPVNCVCDEIDQLLTKEVKLQAYRIIQEALANVVDHASATKACVEVRKGPTGVDVIVRDDGAGFTVAGERSRGSGDTFRGFGLASMAQRATIVGGTLTIDSSPGQGTTVSVTIPYS